MIDLEHFIELIQQGSGNLHVQEITDIFWLALQMEQTEQQQRPGPVPKTNTLNKEPRSIDVAPEQNLQGSTETQPHPKPIYPSIESIADTPVTGKRTQIAGARAIPEPLNIARALRPLHRRVTVQHRQTLDETATAEQIAEFTIASWPAGQPSEVRQPGCLPVFRPTTTRWLDLVLIVDIGASMSIWNQVISELQTICTRQGAFHNVHMWAMDTDLDDGTRLPPLYVYHGMSPATYQSRQHSPRELISPRADRLFLIISDCVSRAWHQGGMLKFMALLAKHHSISIVQMLPQHLWSRTALKRGERVRLRSRQRLASHTKLIAEDHLTDKERRFTATKLPVPVVTLDADSLAQWAQMLVGNPAEATTGILFDLAKQTDHAPSRSVRNLPLDERLERFCLTASLGAQQLAGLLAAAHSDQLTLPIIRMIHQSLVPNPHPTDLAEVFLSGLLLRRTKDISRHDPDRIAYTIAKGVRQQLSEIVPWATRCEIQKRLDRFVDHPYGKPVVDVFEEAPYGPLTQVVNTEDALIRKYSLSNQKAPITQEKTSTTSTSDEYITAPENKNTIEYIDSVEQEVDQLVASQKFSNLQTAINMLEHLLSDTYKEYIRPLKREYYRLWQESLKSRKNIYDEKVAQYNTLLQTTEYIKLLFQLLEMTYDHDIKEIGEKSIEKLYEEHINTVISDIVKKCDMDIKNAYSILYDSINDRSLSRIKQALENLEQRLDRFKNLPEVIGDSTNHTQRIKNNLRDDLRFIAARNACDRAYQNIERIKKRFEYFELEYLEAEALLRDRKWERSLTFLERISEQMAQEGIPAPFYVISSIERVFRALNQQARELYMGIEQDISFKRLEDAKRKLRRLKSIPKRTDEIERYYSDANKLLSGR